MIVIYIVANRSIIDLSNMSITFLLVTSQAKIYKQAKFNTKTAKVFCLVNKFSMDNLTLICYS